VPQDLVEISHQNKSKTGTWALLAGGSKKIYERNKIKIASYIS